MDMWYAWPMNRAHSHRAPDLYEYRRQRAWELHHKGWKQHLIAEALGVSPGAVSQWLKRATLCGPQSLHAQLRPGRPALLTPQQRQQLAALLTQGAEAFGFRGALWTRGRV